MSVPLKFQSCLLAVLCLFTAVARAAYSLPLTTGWNLVSIPEQQTNPDITVVTRSLEGKLTAVWGYENGQWSGYFPGQRASTLARMDAGQAYWVLMAQEGTLVGAGFRPASAINLAPGWNFIGYNGTTARTPTEVFGANLSAIETVQSYEGGAWRIFTPGATGNTLSTLSTGRGYWVRARATTYANFGFTLNARTRSLSDAAVAEISNVTATTVTLPTARASGIVAGDIVTAGIGPNTPSGLLRRISSISTSGTNTTWTTTEAKLQEAVTDGVIGLSLPVASPETAALMQAFLQPGERAEFMRDVEIQAAGGSFTLPAIRISLNRDLQLNTGGFQLGGEIFLEPTVIINIELSGAQIRTFRMALQGRERIQLSGKATSGTASGSISRALITPVPLPSFTVFLGPVPIVFKNEFGINVTFAGSISRNGAAMMTQSANAVVGFRYESSEGFSPINNWENTFALDTQNSVDLSCAFGISGTLKSAIWGTAGPYIGVGAGVSLEAQNSTNAATWGVYGSLTAEVGFEVAAQLTERWGLSTSWAYPIELYKRRLYPNGTGTASGLVVDANGPLAGVTVSASKEGAAVGQSVTTAANGTYSIRLPVQTGYKISFNRTNYAPRSIDSVDIASGEDTPLPQVLMDTSNAPGIVRGIITNAATGAPVRDALLTLRPGLRVSNPESVGIVATTTTDTNGRYEVRNLEPGYYTAVVTATGYITGTVNVLARGGATNENQNGSISPAISSGNWRVVLSWGANPADLDSHLTGPITNSTSRFHVFYGGKGSTAISPFAALDVDDTTSFGPETITISQTITGTYRYYVHHFSGSGSIASSSARVAVYRGNSLLKTYSAPSGSGSYWTVFEIRNGALVDINTMGTSAPPPASPDAASDAFGDASDADPFTLWTTLPAKTAPMLESARWVR